MNIHGITIDQTTIIFFLVGTMLGLVLSFFVYLFYQRKSKRFLSIRSHLKDTYSDIQNAAKKIKELDDLFYNLGGKEI